MGVRLLDEEQVAVFVLRTAIRKVVLGPSRALAFARIRIEHAGLADVVEREVGVCELFLELGTGRHELDHALAQHERIVAKARGVGRDEQVVAHRFSTSSGIS